MELAPSIRNATLPPFYFLLNNAVVWFQALLVVVSPLVPLLGGSNIQDRSMDILFAGYLCLIAVHCIFGRPTFRLIAGLVLVGAYGLVGLIESLAIDNLSAYIFEGKLLLSIALFFCLLDKRPQISDFSVKFFLGAFILGCLIYVSINPGERLQLVNESNYVCMYLGIAMFSYLSFKGGAIKLRHLLWLGLFTLFVIIISQSRTGAAFIVLAWLVYLFDRYGIKLALLVSAFVMVVGCIGIVVAIVLDLPIVKRFEELKNPSKVDRFIYAVEASKIIEKRSLIDNLVRLSYAKPVQNRINPHMEWLTDSKHRGTEVGQLYPHHFHLAYLRILVGHGFIIFLCYLVAIPLVWRVNKYLSLGLLVCSLSMSVPYLSLFFGALHFAMAFPNRSWLRIGELPENQIVRRCKVHLRPMTT